MEPFYYFSAEERRARTRQAQAAGEPLLVRWANIEPDFSDRWLPRAAAAADWLAGAAAVADLGCGSMILARCLHPDQRYIPVDLAARDERTLVLDFNRVDDLARLPDADAGAVLGVIEYSYVPDDFVAALRRYPRIVTSYNVPPGDVGAEQAAETRLEQGWVTHYSTGAFIDLFSRHGFTLNRAQLLNGTQYLFDFR